MLARRQTFILLGDKSDFGRIVEDPSRVHSTAGRTGKTSLVRRRERRVIKVVVAKKTSKCVLSNRSSGLCSIPIVLSPANSYTIANFVRSRNEWMATPRRSTEFCGRSGNYFACGTFAHWRSECVQNSRFLEGNLDSK